MVKAADWLRKNFPEIVQRLKDMLVAIGFISIMATQLWARGISLVLITVIIERAISPVQDRVQNLAKTALTECGKTVGIEQIREEAKAAVGGAISGAVGGVIGGAVRAYLTGMFPSFEPFGVALGIVLGRILSKSFTMLNSNAITDNLVQLGGAIGAGTGSMIGAMVGGSGVVFCSMTGGIGGGLLGGAIGAVGVRYFDSWPLEKFISMLSATAMGLILALHGVIGLLGSLAVIVAMLVIMTLQNKEVPHTSTNGNDEKKEESKPKVDKQKHFEVTEHFRSLLAVIGLIATLSSGPVGTISIIVNLAVIAVMLQLFNEGHASNSLSSVMEAVVKEFGNLNEYMKTVRGNIGVASDVDTVLLVNQCSIGGIIGGAVGGTVGGLIHTLLRATHPVIGEAVGGSAGAMVGWTIGKALTSNMLKNGPVHKLASGAIGGTFGGVTGASFGFIMGGVGGGLAGGVMGMMCDKYLGKLKKNI